MTRAGWPRLLLPLILSLPFLLGGPLRYVLRVSLATGFVLGALATAVLIFPLRKLPADGLSRAQLATSNLVVLALGLFSAALLHNPDFHGVANYVDENGQFAVDAGAHIYNYMYFTRHDPVIYAGFVSTYSFWRALVTFAELPAAINLGWVIVSFTVAAVPAAISFSLLWRFRSQRIWWVGALTCLITGVAVLRYLILPVESFHLMGGFWAQVIGLIPLFLMWLADAIIRDRRWRIAWLVALLALYRYTYGLNLVDLIVAFGALLVLEASGKMSWRVRGALLVAAFMTFCVGYDAWELLRPLLKEWGWIVWHDTGASHAGQQLAMLACAVTIFWWPKGRGMGIGRALRFPMVFAASTTWFASLVRAMPNVEKYYLAKYDFHGAVLAASALVVIAVYWVAISSERFDLWGILGLVAITLLANASQDQLGRGFAAYDRGFREQAFGGPYRRSYPWVMPDAVAFMQQTLSDQHRQFAGYRGSHFPMLTFTNGLFDWKDMHWWRAPTLREDKGTCVFWDTGHDPVLDQRKVSSLCKKVFQQPWGDVEVCARCY